MRAAALLVLALPASALAGVLWTSDFESQNLSDWDSYVLHSNHWYFTQTPAPRHGQYCARAELHNEDTYNSFQRVEVEYSAPLAGFEGSDLYYAFSAQLSSAEPFLPMDHEIAFWESTGGSVYHQVLGVHVDNSTSPAKVAFSTSPENASWAEPWHGSMTADVWHDFVLHAKWSLDPTVGFVELWYDGAQVVQKTFLRTMVSANGTTSMTGGLVNAFHTGILLSPIQANKPVETVYLDRFIIGTTMADVVDAPVDAGTPAPDAGTSDAGTPHDAGTSAGPDAGSTPRDAGTAHPTTDAGSGGGSQTAGGCAQVPGVELALVLLVLAQSARKTKHFR